MVPDMELDVFQDMGLEVVSEVVKVVEEALEVEAGEDKVEGRLVMEVALAMDQVMEVEVAVDVVVVLEVEVEVEVEVEEEVAVV